jgi:hypothetical protein
MFIAFLAGVHHSILAANARTPVHLPFSEVGWISGAFLVATFVWVAILLRRFSRTHS